MTRLPEPTVPDEGFLTWETQVRQYPKVGEPGVTLAVYAVTVAAGVTLAIDPSDNRLKPARITYRGEVDCLLHRNRKGRLTGILNHYPDECRGIDGELLEAAGNVNLWVAPERRRRGIGLRLLAEADRLWSIDWEAQHYTTGGRALAARYLADEGRLACS